MSHRGRDPRLLEVLADPSLIETRREAVMWLDDINTEIASVAAKMEVFDKLPGEKTQEEWMHYHRWAYLRRKLQNERFKLSGREQELRAVAGSPPAEWRKAFAQVVYKAVGQEQYDAWISEARRMVGARPPKLPSQRAEVEPA